LNFHSVSIRAKHYRRNLSILPMVAELGVPATTLSFPNLVGDETACLKAHTYKRLVVTLWLQVAAHTVIKRHTSPRGTPGAAKTLGYRGRPRYNHKLAFTENNHKIVSAAILSL
jgi:hypothetical protein